MTEMKEAAEAGLVLAMLMMVLWVVVATCDLRGVYHDIAWPHDPSIESGR